uniref:Uncharacterized protein n=1 Tax=Lepeophtheirus salmonis TaxID=72036 RepID=A0A0K2VBZ8_LEPSM
MPQSTNQLQVTPPPLIFHRRQRALNYLYAL